jgi:hypothetical protein
LLAAYNVPQSQSTHTQMVLLTFNKNINQWLGPFLLRHGIRLRFALSGGIIRDNPWLDAALLLPLAQRLISLEVHEEVRQAVQGTNGSIWSNLLSLYSSKNKVKRPMMSIEEEAAFRLTILEKYLRPALVGPQQLWYNVRRWQFHSRVVKWARAEFLSAKHGPGLRTSQAGLRHASQLARKRPLDDSDTSPTTTTTQQLPSSATIQLAFGMSHWALKKDLDAVHADMKRIAVKLGGQTISLRGGGLCFANVPEEADVSNLSLEEILEVAGGFVSACGPLNALCEQSGIYQLWSKEFAERLGGYLKARVDAYHGESVILDVGAGDGLLLHAIKDYFKKVETGGSGKPGVRKHGQAQTSKKNVDSSKRPSSPLFVATDNGSWSISQKAPVQTMDVKQAMDAYANRPNRQIIVLCSWMPMGEDWTRAFRDSSVDEYILIGECDDGQCGDNWLSWGNPEYDGDVDNELDFALTLNDNVPCRKMVSISPPQYEVDGYTRRDLDSLLPYQFSRFDCALSKTAKTVSFRRVD